MKGRSAIRFGLVLASALQLAGFAFAANAARSAVVSQARPVAAVPALPRIAIVAPQAVQAAAAPASVAAAQAAQAPTAADQAVEAALAAEAAAAPAAGDAAVTQAAKVFDDAAVNGKSFMLVGTRRSRGFILDETVRVARQLGLKLYLLDRADHRKDSQAVVPDAQFIAAPIDQRDDSSMKKIVEQIAAFAKQVRIDVVAAFRSHHAKLVGRLVDELRVIGVPKKAVVTADDKSKTREVLNMIPEQAVPSRKINSPAAARQAFREMGGGRFVMKSNHGENSRFIEMPLTSEDEVERAYRKMEAALRSYAKQAESSDTIFNRFPGILLERMLEQAPGTVEASVELVVQKGRLKFAVVSDTHGIGANGELAGGAMVFPSQQTAQVQEALIKSSVQALNAIGLKDGNARTDIMMTPDGPRIIEINPYLGGAAIWKAVKVVTGVSLVEYGIRALLGLNVPAQPRGKTVVDYRFAASPVDGVIEAVEGLDEARQMPGIEHVQLLIAVGDRVSAPIGNGFEEWLEVFGTGKDAAEARASSVAALSKIKLRVRKDDGTLVETTADFAQPKS